MSQTTTYFDLLDALKEEGCPICRLALKAVAHYIDSVNYEFVNDPGFRIQTEAAQGFCNVHAAHWLKQAHPLGTALIYDDVLGLLSEKLKQLRLQRPSLLDSVASVLNQRGPSGRTGNGWLEPLRPDGPCPICRTRAEEESRLVSVLIESLAEPELTAAYDASAGLCLPHLRQAFGAMASADEPAFAILRDDAVARQEQLRTELREIIRKHDYRFREEPTGAERGATERAVRHVAGAPGILSPGDPTGGLGGS